MNQVRSLAKTLLVVPEVFPPVPPGAQVEVLRVHLKRTGSWRVTMLQLLQQALRFSKSAQMSVSKRLVPMTHLCDIDDIRIQQAIRDGGSIIIVNPLWSGYKQYQESFEGQIAIYLVDAPMRLGFDVASCRFQVFSYDPLETSCAHIPPYATVYERGTTSPEYDLYYIGGFTVTRYLMVLIACALACIAHKRILFRLYSGRRFINWLPMVRSRRVSWKTNIHLLMRSKATVEYLLSDCRAPSVRWYDAKANGKLVLSNNYHSRRRFDPFLIVSLFRFLLLNETASVADSQLIFFSEWLTKFNLNDGRVKLAPHV